MLLSPQPLTSFAIPSISRITHHGVTSAHHPLPRLRDLILRFATPDLDIFILAPR